MNKSKFLKKSLAALLAVMLVVAMIPLSAAAANLPNMTMLYIGGSTVNVESDGKTFKYDIGRGTDNITVRPDKTILGTSDTQFELRPLDNTSAHLPGNAIGSDGTNGTLAISTYGTVSPTNSNIVTITLRLWEKDAPEQNYKDFTLELTRKDLNGEPVLASVSHDMELGGDTGVFESSLDQSSHTVKVTATRLINAQTKAEPKIRLTTGEGSTIAAGSGAVPRSVTTVSSSVVDVNLSYFGLASKNNAIKVTSQDGKKFQEWNIEVTYVDAMMSIALGENSKYAGELKDTTNTDPSTPGTPVDGSSTKDKYHDTIIIGVDRSEAYNADGTSKDVNLPVFFQAHGNVTQITITPFATHNTSGYEAAKTLKPGDKYNFGKVTGYTPYKADGMDLVEDTSVYQGTLSVKVDDKGTPTTQVYNLFVVLKSSDDKAITFARLDGQIAKIEGTKITAVLPKYKKGTNDPTDVSKVTVVLCTGTTLTGGSINLDYNVLTDKDNASDTIGSALGWTSASDTISGSTNSLMWTPKYEYTPNGGTLGSRITTVNLSSSKIITVTAQDGSKLQYEISVTKAVDDQNAVINSMTLKNDKTEETYTGTIKDNTITFTVPYMTLDISTWKVFATCNDSAYIVLPGGGKSSPAEVDLISGTTQAKELATGTTAVDGITAVGANGLSTTANTNKGKIMVRNMNNSEVKIDYDVIINLAEPKAGNELTSLNFAALTDTTPVGQKFDKIQERVTDDNKFTTVKSVEDGKNILTYSPAFSLSTAAGKNPVSYLGCGVTPDGQNKASTNNVWNVVTSVTTSEGGVAFFAKQDYQTAGQVSRLAPIVALPTGSSSFTTAGDSDTTPATVSLLSQWGTDKRPAWIIVLPEKNARLFALRGVYTSANGNGWPIVDVSTIYADFGGRAYELKEAPAKPSKESEIKTLKIKDTALSVGRYDSAENPARTITGELPYSYTVEAANSALSTSNTFFPEFTLDKYAQWANFYSKGDTDGDGEAEAVGSSNQKLYFVRNSDHTVDVYTTDAESGAGVGTKIGFKGTPTTVLAEDRLDTTVTDKSKIDYTFKLTWADPNPNANITEFKVGNSVGVISGHNITVTVPFNTNLRSQVVSFKASPQAKVYIGSTNTEVVSEKTTLNFTAPITLQVKSEDGNKTETYVVTVREGNMFNDVHESDWFYSVVIEAATKGWINGRDATTFDPYSNMTRGEFATIIARIDLGSQEAVDNYTSDSRFPDVPTDHFASKGIAYCADKNYINGVGDGNFDPNSPITREQAAAIICRMKGIEAVDGDTTYADDAKISGWAKGLVKAATANGIFEGEGADFNPQRTLRRCEGAAALVRAAKYVK